MALYFNILPFVQTKINLFIWLVILRASRQTSDIRHPEIKLIEIVGCYNKNKKMSNSNTNLV